VSRLRPHRPSEKFRAPGSGRHREASAPDRARARIAPTSATCPSGPRSAEGGQGLRNDMATRAVH